MQCRVQYPLSHECTPSFGTPPQPALPWRLKEGNEAGSIRGQWVEFNRKAQYPSWWLQKPGARWALTVSDQHQSGLGLGFSILDLHGESALAVLSEMIHHHLDNACGHVVTHFSLLRKKAGRDKHFSHRDTADGSVAIWLGYVSSHATGRSLT